MRLAIGGRRRIMAPNRSYSYINPSFGQHLREEAALQLSSLGGLRQGSGSGSGGGRSALAQLQAVAAGGCGEGGPGGSYLSPSAAANLNSIYGDVPVEEFLQAAAAQLGMRGALLGSHSSMPGGVGGSAGGSLAGSGGDGDLLDDDGNHGHHGRRGGWGGPCRPPHASQHGLDGPMDDEDDDGGGDDGVLCEEDGRAASPSAVAAAAAAAAAAGAARRAALPRAKPARKVGGRTGGRARCGDPDTSAALAALTALATAAEGVSRFVGHHARDQDAAAAAAGASTGVGAAWIPPPPSTGVKLVEAASSKSARDDGTRAARGPRAASRFIGVTWRERIQRWEVRAEAAVQCTPHPTPPYMASCLRSALVYLTPTAPRAAAPMHVHAPPPLCGGTHVWGLGFGG